MINITTPEGELLERLSVEPNPAKGDPLDDLIRFTRAVRDHIERRFETADDL
jgi:hypothetical protein